MDIFVGIWLAGWLLFGLFLTINYPVEKRTRVFMTSVIIMGALWFIFVPRWILRRIQ